MRLTKISKESELLEHHIKDLYSAENQIIEALPDIIEKVSDTELAQKLQMHLEETRMHAARLEQAGDALDIKVKGVECKGMKGLLEEGSEAIKNIEEGELLDMELISGCRKVEHYEILAYASLINLMNATGCSNEVVALMEETLDEEEAADLKLANLEE